jgi:hypothetical protein
MVDVPHFPGSERIPLRRTPLYCTHNDNIQFYRNAAGLVGEFELFRLRLRGATYDRTVPTPRPRDPGASALLDVVLYHKDDDELRLAWSTSEVVTVDAGGGVRVDVLSPQGCIADLLRMRDVYDVSSERHAKTEAMLSAALSTTDA